MPVLSVAPALTSTPVQRERFATSPSSLYARVIDNDPILLEQSYHLRHQVYCVERRFLAAADYPDKLEIDEFDEHSVHIGVLNAQGDLLGTARLVEPSAAGLPLFQHCSLFEDTPFLNQRRASVIETGRLAVSRHAEVPENGTKADILLHIYKGVYQASKRFGYTHWLAATEKSLQRLMLKCGFPWRAVGPEADYYGKVAPYLLSLDEFDSVILSRRIPRLDVLLEGLEPEFRPMDFWRLIGALR
jgi:N-acyl amino acid synthase of PEP-CTERM/exosortase system